MRCGQIPLSPRKRSRRARCLVCTFWQQKVKLDQVVVSLLILETCGRRGCPKSADWDGEVESWTESEGTSSSVQCEHNMESLALSAMEQDQSGEKIFSLPGSLGTCEGGSELTHRPGYVVPGNARALVAGMLLSRGSLSQQKCARLLQQMCLHTRTVHLRHTQQFHSSCELFEL